MAAKRSRRRGRDTEASDLLEALMADRGWCARDVAVESVREGVGHPLRGVSERTVYRVTTDGYVPTSALQFEIAAVFGLLPSHIWGNAPLPEPYAYLNEHQAVAA